MIKRVTHHSPGTSKVSTSTSTGGTSTLPVFRDNYIAFTYLPGEPERRAALLRSDRVQ